MSGLLIFLAPSIRNNNRHRDDSEHSEHHQQQQEELFSIAGSSSSSSSASSSSNQAKKRYQKVIFRDVRAERNQHQQQHLQQEEQDQIDEDHIEDIEEVGNEDEADLVALVPEELSDQDGTIDDAELMMDDDHVNLVQNHHHQNERHRKFHFRFARNNQNRNQQQQQEGEAEQNENEAEAEQKKSSSILLKIPSFLRTNIFNSIFHHHNHHHHHHSNYKNFGNGGGSSSSRRSSHSNGSGGAAINGEHHPNHPQQQQQQSGSFNANATAAASSIASLVNMMEEGDCFNNNNNNEPQQNHHNGQQQQQHQHDLPAMAILAGAANNFGVGSASLSEFLQQQYSKQILNSYFYYYQQNSKFQSDAWYFGRNNLLAYYINKEKILNKNQQPPIFKHETFKFESLEKNTLLPDLSPLPRSGHRIVSDKHYVYLFGGFNPQVAPTAIVPDEKIWRQTKPLFKELWRFSKLTQTWQYLPTTGTAPMELASHCALLIDQNKLLVYGGSGMPFGMTSSNKIYLCDLKRLSWTQIIHENPLVLENQGNNIPQMNPDIPEPAYGQSIAYDQENEKLYVCGGTSGYDYSLNLYEFNMKTKYWRCLSLTPPNIEPRYRHEMVLYERKLYIIGGGTAEQSFSMEKIPVFDLIEEKWSLQQAKPWKSSNGEDLYPSPRYSHDIGLLNNRFVYMVGGADQQKAMDDTWSLDLQTLQWNKHEQAQLPEPSYFHSATMDEQSGEMFVFGGVNCVHRKRRNNAMNRCWFGVPTLQRMSQEAIKKYLQYSLNNKDDKKENKTHQFNIKHLQEYFHCLDINHKTLDLPEI